MVTDLHKSYHNAPAADTFLHPRQCREIMVFGSGNAVQGVIHRLSLCHFECLGGQDNQSGTAK